MLFCLFLQFCLSYQSHTSFPRDVEARCHAATLRLYNKEGAAVGTAVLIGSRNDWYYALTARHVVIPGGVVQATAYDPETGKSKADLPRAEIIGDSMESDLALLRFPVGKQILPVVSIATASKLLPKAPFKGLTYGCQKEGMPTAEYVQVLSRKLVIKDVKRTAFFWETDRAPDEGRSGGPLFSEGGQLIGICSARQGGKGYYSHLDEIQSLLKQLGHTWLYESAKKP